MVISRRSRNQRSRRETISASRPGQGRDGHCRTASPPHRVTCSPSHLLSPTEHVTRRRKPLPENHLLTAPESHAHLLTCSTGPKLPQNAVRAADALRGHPWPGTVSHARATAATSPATAGTLGPASGRCRYLGIFPRCASHLGHCPRCARRPGHRGYLAIFARCAPGGMDCLARTHTHHRFPEGAPGQGIVARPGTVWHLPGAAAACQTANGPPAAGVRTCGPGPTRPTGPSHLATGPERGSAATQGVGAEGAARFTADEAGRWGRAPIVRRRPPRWDSCRRRRRLPQALASRNWTWCAPCEHFGR
jgi:hypothetical protein